MLINKSMHSVKLNENYMCYVVYIILFNVEHVMFNKTHITVGLGLIN